MKFRSMFFAGSIAFSLISSSASLQAQTGDSVVQIPQPNFCRTDLVTIRDASTAFFMPPRVRGDREFSGNGPRIYVRAELIYSDVVLGSRLYMSAVETKSDWSTAEGERTETLYSVPPGWRISRVIGDLSSDYSYTDNDHDRDIFNLASGELVRQFVIVGDTSGNDIEVDTGVQAYFNDIQVELIEFGNNCR